MTGSLGEPPCPFGPAAVTRAQGKAECARAIALPNISRVDENIKHSASYSILVQGGHPSGENDERYDSRMIASTRGHLQPTVLDYYRFPVRSTAHNVSLVIKPIHPSTFLPLPPFLIQDDMYLSSINQLEGCCLASYTLRARGGAVPFGYTVLSFREKLESLAQIINVQF
jgi:hypothetical protein